jgi:hypothetical protein
MLPHQVLVKSSLILFLLIFSIYGCKKEKHLSPIEQLPPATDTGANTFGCLVNGEAVVIHHLVGDLSPAFGCQYQLIYPTVSGYTLNVHATDEVDGCHFKSVGVYLDSVQLGENIYILNTDIEKHGNRGLVNIANGCPPSPFLIYWTDSTITGQLSITHFDQQKQIVSGTFYFDAVETSSGDTVHVTDGRFDMIYTQ